MLAMQRIELEVAETLINEFRSAAANTSEDLENFLISAGKTRSASILIDISLRNDSGIPINGYRYIVRESKCSRI